MNMPRHVAIIPDGNRRWARERGLDDFEGHIQGFETAKKIVEFLFRQGVKIVTIYTLSKDNLMKRNEEEVRFLLFNVFETALDGEIDKLAKEGTRLRFIGDLGILPKSIQKKMGAIEGRSILNSENTLAIAIAYSGRDEIVRAVQRIIGNGYTKPESITERLISDYLDTNNLSDPDLVIRTAGEQRLSDFMPWQSVYAELYFIEKYWPNVQESDMVEALKFYESRIRKFGA